MESSKKMHRGWSFKYHLYRYLCQKGVRVWITTLHPHERDVIRIGDWLHQQRVQYNKGRLPERRLLLLREVEQWNVWERKRIAGENTKGSQPDEDGWLSKCELYARLSEEREIPIFYVTSEDASVPSFRLGLWLAHQRRYYTSGKLAPDRLSRLRQIRAWTIWETTRNEKPGGRAHPSWEEMYGIYVSLCAEGIAVTSKYRTPPDHLYPCLQIGNWLKKNRQAHMRGKLSEERLRMLGEVEQWNSWVEFGCC